MARQVLKRAVREARRNGAQCVALLDGICRRVPSGPAEAAAVVLEDSSQADGAGLIRAVSAAALRVQMEATVSIDAYVS